MPVTLARVPTRRNLGSYLSRALKDTGDSMKISVTRTTLYWLQQPIWKRAYSGVRTRYSVALTTTDPFWRKVNAGTDTIDVILSSNYEAKTVPGSIYGRPGRGRAIRRGVPGQPGIIPRGWTGLIADIERPRMRNRLQRAIQAYVKAVL